MNTFKRILALVCALTLAVGILSGCHEEPAPTDPTDGTTAPSGDVSSTSYTVSVKSAGGLPLAGVTLLAYSDAALTSLCGYGQTDAQGQAVITVNGADSLYITLTNVPEGYTADASYPVSGRSTEILLASQVIADSNHSGVKYQLGSVMHDFTVTASDGNSYTLSKLLQEKDAVILNFWYTTCTYCVQEFPYLDAVYKLYGDSVEVLALNNTGYDSDSEVAEFCDYYYEMYDSDETTTGGLSFPMANEDLGVGDAFSLSGYPTTVVIDRYGVVSFIYAGGLPSDAYWTYIFDAFVGDDYTQTLYSGMDELLPEIKPTYEMPSSEEIAGVLSSGSINVTYSGEEGTDDAELSWPFIIGEKDGVACLYASNAGVESSFATMYANVTLEAGDVLAFDYYSSCESGADVLYVLVDRDDVYQISGEGSGWKTCYTWVAEEAGEYEIAFCYLKDSSDNVADDTVYLSNLRVVGIDDIDIATYIPRECATDMRADGFGYENYATVVYNEADGYYHVGTANGPLLLASLMMGTNFSTDPIYTLAYNGEIVIDGYDYYNDIVKYCSYASNSQIYSLVAVNQELKELLVKVTEAVGIEKSENEWLQICSYYDAYGTGGVQMTDPAAGLALYNAYTAQLGMNTVSYDRVIMPRGLLYKFVPTKSGVYRITSHSDTYVDGWVFDPEGWQTNEAMYTYWFNERAWTDDKNVSMVLYLEAGKEYYIDIAFYDVYGVGSIDFTVEYEAASMNLLILASPGYFTYYDETTYEIVAGGIEVALGDDGYYHELLSDGSLGSKLYVDMVSYSSIFNNQSLFDLIKYGSFDFSKTDDDEWILDYYDYFEELDFNGTDFETCLREVWGENFDTNWEELMVEDVLDGYYHGKGEDMTAVAEKYANKISKSGELYGCVAVNEELGEILQMLMDKYSFSGVEHSWTKLCYYYDYLGPDANK